MEKLVSVIMSTYNERLDWLSKAVESILNQSYYNLQFLVVIDNPQNADLINLLKKYAEGDKRITLIFNDVNVGLVKSLNKALKHVKGEYVARMDADDISLPDRLEKQVAFLENNTCYDLLGGNVSWINENDEVILEKNNIITSPKKLKMVLKHRNALHHPTWMFRSSILKDSRVNEYRNVPLAEDYDFTTRLLSYGYNIINIEDVVLKYRLRENGISISNAFNQIKMSEYVRKMYIRRLKGLEDQYDKDEIRDMLKDCKGKELFEHFENKKRGWMSKNIIYGRLYEMISSIFSKYHRMVFVNCTIYKIKLLFVKE